jgi:hypothetical protein
VPNPVEGDLSHLRPAAALQVRYGTKKGLTMASPPHRILGCPIDHLHPSSFVTANSTTPGQLRSLVHFGSKPYRRRDRAEGKRKKKRASHGMLQIAMATAAIDVM